MEEQLIETTGEVVESPTDVESPEVSEDESVFKEGEGNIKSQLNQIKQLIDIIKEQVQTLEQIWFNDKAEFPKITHEMMNTLKTYNEEHKTHMPEGLSKEEEEAWDNFNGIDNITEEEVVKIFTEDNNIIGITHDITKDRIKSCLQDWCAYTDTLIEFNRIVDAYNELLEEDHDSDMEVLRLVMEKETDPEKKEKLKNALDQYWYDRRITFIAEPLLANDKERLIKNFSNAEKIKYYMNRGKDNLAKMGITSKCILEISHFEKTFLDEKYHKLDNMLLLYFMQTATFCKPSDPSNLLSRRLVFMSMALDSIIKHRAKPEVLEILMNNIKAFEDQFIDEI